MIKRSLIVLLISVIFINLFSSCTSEKSVKLQGDVTLIVEDSLYVSVISVDNDLLERGTTIKIENYSDYNTDISLYDIIEIEFSGDFVNNDPIELYDIKNIEIVSNKTQGYVKKLNYLKYYKPFNYSDLL